MVLFLLEEMNPFFQRFVFMTNNAYRFIYFKSETQNLHKTLNISVVSGKISCRL